MILRVYKQSIRILFFCLCLFHSGLSHAQQYKLTQQFGFKDGLLSYAIGQMLVDSNGMMWLNNDGNLFVYDGKQFELISSKNGQDRERISTDLLNINGSIYFIDRHGAYLVYPEEFRIGGSDTAILNEYRQSKREALALETLFKGILLELGTTGNLKTFRRTLDDQQVQMLVHYSKMQSTNTGESDYHISSIQHGDSMVIVIDTFIFMLNDHQLKVAEISSDVPEEDNGLYFQGKVGNHIYLMNANGFFRLGFTNGQLQMVPVMNGIEYNDNYSYCTASLNNDETIFLGTVYRGLLRFDKVKLRVYDNLERIVYHENSSLKQYSATKYTYALKRKSLQAELSTNSIWLINGDIHANNGMYWDAETGALKGASPFFFPAYNIDYIDASKNGLAYFKNLDNAKEFIFQYDIVKKKLTRMDRSRIPTFVGGVSSFWKGDTLYIHSHKVIYTLYKGVFTKKFELPYLSGYFYNHRYCYGIHIVNDSIWMATPKGIFVANSSTGSWALLPGSMGKDFRRIQAYSNNTLLFFSYGMGLFKYRNGRLTPVHDLTNNPVLKYIHYTFTDNHNRVWIASNLGLYFTNSITWNNWISGALITPKFYKVSSIEMNTGTDHSYVVDNTTGDYYLSSIQGVIKIRPDEFQTTYSSRPIVLRSVKSEDGTIQDLTALPVRFKSLQFTFKISCLQQEQVFPLEVFDVQTQTWKVCKDNEYMFYRERPGWQELKFRYVDDITFSFANERVVRFYVIPYWYERLDVQILSAIVLIFIIALIVYVSRRRQIRKENFLKAQVDARTKELNLTVHKLIESDRQMKQNVQMKEKLINVLAHDIRSPLVSTNIVCESLRADVERLDTSPFKEQASYKLGLITESIDSISSFSNDFLTWYKLHNKSGTTDFSSANIYRLLIKVIEFYNPVIHAHRNQITYDIDTAQHVYTDPSLLTIVLRNLIDNANKYSKNSTIHIYTVEADGYIRIRVKNAPSRYDEDLLDEMNGKIKSGMRGDEHYEPKFGLNLVGFIVQRLQGEIEVSYAELKYLVVEVKLKASAAPSDLQL